MVYPNNYNWVGNTLTFQYDETNADGVWIQFKPSNSNDYVTILQVIDTCPKSCELDTNTYGTSGLVRGSVKPKTSPGGFPPPGNVTEITNQPV
jgi:hypothetical protein